jgi:hypothetical protein
VATCDPSGRSYSNLAPGEHTFRVQGVNSLGLVGPRTSYAWTIDTANPNTVIESHPEGTVLTDSATFTFSSNEADADFVCKVDTGGFQSCDSPTTLNALNDGGHTFRVAAIDQAGNGDPTPDSFTFDVRTTPTAPAITSGPGPGAVTSPQPSFAFDARYAAGFQCRFDAQDFRPCSDGQAHTPGSPLGHGPHTFEVRGFGHTGTPGPTTSRPIAVDAMPPQTTITAGPDGRIVVPTARFGFAASEAGAGFYCRVDTGPFVRCDDRSYATGELTDGAHTFSVSAVDGVGNNDPTPDRRNFIVDTKPSMVAGPAEGELTGPRPTFRFSSPSAAFFQCRFDAQRYKRCSGDGAHTSPTRLSTSWHTFHVRGVTASGRISPPTVRRFKADATAPRVTFPREPRVNAQARAATVSFRARDASAVARTVCSLDAGAWRRCTSPVTYRYLSAGRHTVRVRSADEWGNVSAPVAVRWQQPRKT